MTLLLTLDRQSNLSLVEQIVASVTRAIDGRTLRPGDALPSVRALARNHMISPFTVAQAYQGLGGVWSFDRATRCGLSCRGSDTLPGQAGSCLVCPDTQRSLALIGRVCGSLCSG
jgi:hypothetical protein